MSISNQLIVSAALFGKHVVGIVVRPYETYRKLVERGGVWELVYVFALAAVYFALASLVRVDAFRPFLLTKQFVVLGGGGAAIFILATLVFWIVGNILGGKGTYHKLVLCWGYTLIPTVCWFLMTSLLYVVLPPPRLDSLKGNAFSLLFLIVSCTLFFWKAVLYYLTLRFALRLDFVKITVVTVVSMPIFVGVSVWMYRMGIFRVPFI